MNDIHTEDDRYTQTALLHCDLLQFIDAVYAFQVKQGAYPALTDLLCHIGRLRLTGDNLTRYRHTELTEFLLHGHLSHQLANKSVHLSVR